MTVTPDLTLPWQWPDVLRGAVETYLVRRFGPSPGRLLPPDPRTAAIARVVATQGELDRLMSEKPPLWIWAALASALLQRRNDVLPRLLNCAAGYQPGPGSPLSAAAYAELARQTMRAIAEHRTHLTSFMLSPAYTAVANAEATGQRVDPAAILHVADRLMQYHANFLAMAEHCLSTPVAREATVLAYDTSTLAVCPLVTFGEFIVTLCHRVAEARERLPYSGGRAISVDNPELTIGFPHGLEEQINAQISRFSS